MAIVLEILDAANQRVAMQQFEGPEVVVGRAYDCDFIIHDPHVDPYHCRITCCALSTGYTVSDENSLNGTRAEGPQLKGESTSIASGDLITVGKTRLRVSNPVLGVAATVKLDYFDTFVEWASNTGVSLCFLLLVGLYTAIDTYLHSDATFKLSDIFTSLLAVFGTIFAITGFWSLIGRISKRRANIAAHATIAAILWLLGSLWKMLLDVTLYNFNGMDISHYLVLVSLGLLTIAGQFVHLKLASNLSLRVRWFIVGLMFCIYPGLSLYSTLEERDEFRRYVNFPARIFPPGWYFGSGVEPEQFVERSANSFEAANREVDAMKLKDEKLQRQEEE